MKRLALCLLFLGVAIVAEARALKSTGNTNTSVSVTASNAGTQLTASINETACFGLASTAAVSVWIVPVDTGTACSSFTTPGAGGVQISAGNAYCCSPDEAGNICYNYVGQVCGILSSGSTAVTVSVTKR